MRPKIHSEKLLTGQDLWAMGDTGLSELVAGRFVEVGTATNTHGRGLAAILTLLYEFVEKQDSGRLAVGGVGIYTQRDPDTVRAADLLFIAHERSAQVKTDDFLDVPPNLIVEVLSPSDSWYTLIQKLREYFEIGVDLVWVADPDMKTVYVYRSLTDLREFTEEDELPGDDILPGFSVPVASLFDI
jgi:Uma2 family endonuclease